MFPFLVYKFGRGQYSSICICETPHHLSARSAKHKGISIRASKPLTVPCKSSFRHYALQTGYGEVIEKTSQGARYSLKQCRI